MYLEFYGLREEPFGDTPDPRFLYPSPSYQEAQATLEYGIRSGRGFTALIAQPGMGKTTLLFDLLERHSATARTAFVFLTQCDSREFLRYLMSELEADSGESDIVRLQEQFGQLLAREAQAGRKVIAVVDEAHNLDIRVLETVRLLSDFETPRAKLLHIILAGQPELADRLNSPALLQLRQRISHLVRLEPLSAEEVSRYIDHRLRAAGAGDGSVFSAEARALIAERSQGIPRVINNLCCNALLLGFAKGQRAVGGELLAEVCDDLDFEAITGARETATGEDDIAAALEQESSQPVQDRPDEAPPAMTGDDLAAVLGQGSSQPVQNWPSEAPGAGDTTAAGPGQKSSQPVQDWPSEAPSADDTTAAGPGQKSSQPVQDWPSEAPAAMAAAVPAEAAYPPSWAGGELAAETPAAAEPPGPVLAPAAQAEETPAPEDVANWEMSNLALHLMKDGISAEEPPATPSSQETPPPMASEQTQRSSGNSNGTAEAAEGQVDVESLAADCALFGMEEPRRWKTPAARAGKPVSTTGPMIRQNGTGVRPRPNAPRVMANRGLASAAQPVNARGSMAKAPVASINRGRRAAADNKLWPDRPPAGGDERRRRSQRNLYLAAAGSALLLLILIWLLSSSAPSSPSPEAAEVQPAAQEATQTDPAAGNGGANDPGSVLDVSEEAPQPGQEAGAREAPPAVVMRANHGEELLYRVDPVYPAAARANGIQGAVVLEATIGDHGFLRHIRVLSGDPLLADAVLDAVRGWRYRTRTEHGRPVESETRIVVNFRLVTAGRNSAQSR